MSNYQPEDNKHSETEESPCFVENSETIETYKKISNVIWPIRACARWAGGTTHGRPTDVVDAEELYSALLPLRRMLNKESPLYKALAGILRHLLTISLESKLEDFREASKDKQLVRLIAANSEHHDELDRLLEIVISQSIVSAPDTTGVAQYRFIRCGDYWDVVFCEKAARIKDSKGMQYLAKILADANPVKCISGIELSGEAIDLSMAEHTFQSVLDPEAKEEYKERIEDLDEELNEARANNDLGRMEVLEVEHQKVSSELLKNEGLGGRDRRLGSSNPQRRSVVAVRQALQRAYNAIKKHLPDLAAHLGDHVRNEDNGFAYRPGPSPPDWDLCPPR